MARMQMVAPLSLETLLAAAQPAIAHPTHASTHAPTGRRALLPAAALPGNHSCWCCCCCYTLQLPTNPTPTHLTMRSASRSSSAWMKAWRLAAPFWSSACSARHACAACGRGGVGEGACAHASTQRTAPARCRKEAAPAPLPHPTRTRIASLGPAEVNSASTQRGLMAVSTSGYASRKSAG